MYLGIGPNTTQTKLGPEVWLSVILGPTVEYIAKNEVGSRGHSAQVWVAKGRFFRSEFKY